MDRGIERREEAAQVFASQKPVAAKKAIRGAKLALLKIEHGVHLLQQVKSGDRRQEEQEGERLQKPKRKAWLP